MKTRIMTVRSVLNKYKRRDEWFIDDYSYNPYTGCSFNCIYCYTHGSKYGRVRAEVHVKINAPTILNLELAKTC